MTSYMKKTITTKCGTVIHLRCVESITVSTDNHDAVIDKLANDIILTIRTISGMVYYISTQYIKSEFNFTESSPEEIARAIIDRWIYVVN